MFATQTPVFLLAEPAVATGPIAESRTAVLDTQLVSNVDLITANPVNQLQRQGGTAMPLVAICSVKCREIFIPPWQESVPCGSQVLGPELIAGQKNATTVKVAIENSESAQNDRATIGQIE